MASRLATILSFSYLAINQPFVMRKRDFVVKQISGWLPLGIAIAIVTYGRHSSMSEFASLEFAVFFIGSAIVWTAVGYIVGVVMWRRALKSGRPMDD